MMVTAEEIYALGMAEVRRSIDTLSKASLLTNLDEEATKLYTALSEYQIGYRYARAGYVLKDNDPASEQFRTAYNDHRLHTEDREELGRSVADRIYAADPQAEFADLIGALFTEAAATGSKLIDGIVQGLSEYVDGRNMWTYQEPLEPETPRRARIAYYDMGA